MAKKKQKKTKYWKSDKNTVHREGYAEGKTAYREITGRALVLKLIRPVLIKLLRGNKLDEINYADDRKLIPETYQSEEEIKNVTLLSSWYHRATLSFRRWGSRGPL